MLLNALYFGATFALALGFGLYLTPIIRRAAVRFGVLDVPDGLKDHGEPVPYLGGIAVYLAFLLTLAFVFDFDASLLGLLLGATMVAMLGMFDDMRVLAPRLKLFGQFLAVVVLVKSDVTIHLISLPWWLAVALSAAWMIIITNSINIIDVSDGLATGVSAIAGLALFVLAVLHGNILIATTTLALVGALIGFLRYNQTPASIYLGDTGSLFVGFMLAALSMIGTYTARSDIAALAPLFILAVPLLDTAVVSIARIARRRSPLVGSHDHFTHRLRRRGWGPRRIAYFGYGTGIAGGILGVAMTMVDAPTAMILAGAGGVGGSGLLIWILRLPSPAAASGAVAEPEREARVESV